MAAWAKPCTARMPAGQRLPALSPRWCNPPPAHRFAGELEQDEGCREDDKVEEDGRVANHPVAAAVREIPFLEDAWSHYTGAATPASSSYALMHQRRSLLPNASTIAHSHTL